MRNPRPDGRVIDAHPRLRAVVAAGDPARVGAIVHLLGDADIESVTAYHVHAALAAVAEQRVDLVVLGDGVSGATPEDLLGRVRARTVCPILVVAGHTSLDPTSLFDAGADDVVGAHARPSELLARVRSLLRRSAASPPPGRLPDGLAVDVRRLEASVDGHPLGLTPIELDLLAALAARPGDVVDHRTLLRAGWGDRADPDPDLLRTHLTHLNAKLVARGHPGLRNVRSRGYAIRVAGEPPEVAQPR